jgi:hypothetical protein
MYLDKPMRDHVPAPSHYQPADGSSMTIVAAKREIADSAPR